MDFSIVSFQHAVERCPDPDWKMPQSTLPPDLYILGAALDGQAEYHINGKTVLVEKESAVLLTPGTVRSARALPDNPWHMITIGCHLQFPNTQAQSGFEKIPLYFPHVPAGLLLQCRELACVWNSKRPHRTLQAKGLMYQIFYELLELCERQQLDPLHFDRITRIQEYIQQHYAERLYQKQLAELCGYSESHFRQLFHTVTGMSCSQYILSVRMEAAKNLLLSGTANVSEAARLTGFSDIYQFSKTFKRIVGSPPSSYKA